MERIVSADPRVCEDPKASRTRWRTISWPRRLRPRFPEGPLTELAWLTCATAAVSNGQIVKDEQLSARRGNLDLDLLDR